MSSLIARPILCSWLAVFVLTIAAVQAQSQTQASCSFTFFQADFPNSMVLTPEGINDYSTVVGSTSNHTAFLRWSNGSLIFPKGLSDLVTRNNRGEGAGYDHNHNTVFVERNGATSPAPLIVGSTTYNTFGIGTMNLYSTIGGWFTDSSGKTHGVRRFAGFGGEVLDFPGTNISGTFVNALNSPGQFVGTVIGTIPGHPGLQHGFFHRHSEWEVVDFPSAAGTQPARTSLVGLTESANVAIGNAFLDPTSQVSTPFLYENGVFKLISPPGMVSPRVTGMSLKHGLIVGWGYPPQGTHPQRGFIATCK